MARWISDETGADLFRIVPSEAYGEDYNACADRAKNELDNGSSNGANSVNRVSELAEGANVRTDEAFSISGNSVADSEKEIREWADSVFDN